MRMTTVKTAWLSGAHLDWAVAQAEGVSVVISDGVCRYEGAVPWVLYSPSSDWATGSQIINKHGATVRPHRELWMATTTIKSRADTLKRAIGLSPLIAIMRCLVLTKYGDEMEVPEVSNGN